MYKIRTLYLENPIYDHTVYAPDHVSTFADDHNIYQGMQYSTWLVLVMDMVVKKLQNIVDQINLTAGETWYR